LVDALAGAGFPPVLVDLPGHGTDAGTTDAASFTLDAALSRVDAAGSWPADVIGYSMGGRIALHHAAAHPGRVRRLVLESASPGLADESEREERRRADDELATSIVREGIEWFVDHWESLPLFESRARVAPQARMRLRESRLRNDPRSLAAALRGLGTGALPSVWGQLERIDVPTLLIVGERDEKFVEIADRMTRLMPRARMAKVPGVGHTVHVEAPDAWLDHVVAFLAS